MQDTNALSILLFSEVFNLMVYSKDTYKYCKCISHSNGPCYVTHEHQVLKKEKVRLLKCNWIRHAHPPVK